MLKINYPKDRTAFEKAYLKAFKNLKLKGNLTGTIEDKFEEFININSEIKSEFFCLKQQYVETLKHEKLSNFQYILIAPFEDLNSLKRVLKKINEKSLKDKLKKIFCYDSPDKTINAYIGGQSKKVKGFFKKSHQKINLSTCYYCNIDYANYFNENQIRIFNNKVDFLRRANDIELKLVIGGGENIKKIIDHIRSELKNKTDFKSIIEALQSQNKREKEAIEKIENLSLETHLKTYGLCQLDHFIGKADFPLFALSLYNFVPSCTSCNSSTLKGAKELEGTLSPTSANYNYDEIVKFSLYFDQKDGKETFKKKGTQLDTQQVKIKLRYNSNDNSYKNYEPIFKTNERYSFHKRVIDELLEKKKKYPQSRINEMAKLLKMSPEKIKKDIFGEEIFDENMRPETKPFTKLKRDIAEQIGLITT